MGTNYEYNAEDFEEILSRLGNDETESRSVDDFVDSENGLGSFSFSDLEPLNLDDLSSSCNSRGTSNLNNIRFTGDLNDIDAETLDLGSDSGCTGDLNDIDAAALGSGINNRSTDNFNDIDDEILGAERNNRSTDNSRDIDFETLGLGSNSDCSNEILNSREWYQRGLREGLEQGFRRGFSRGRQQGREVGLREGFNTGLERGLCRADELARAAYQRGLRDGYQRGLRDGYRRGFRDGCNAGLERGRREGFNNGFRTGYNRALRDVTRAVNNLSSNANVVTTPSNGTCASSWRNLQ